MTLEEEVRKLNDYYQKHKTELSGTRDGDGLDRALDLLYDMYFTDSKDTNALRKVICELISTHNTVEHLRDQVCIAYEENAHLERMNYNNMRGLHDIR